MTWHSVQEMGVSRPLVLQTFKSFGSGDFNQGILSCYCVMAMDSRQEKKMTLTLFHFIHTVGVMKGD